MKIGSKHKMKFIGIRNTTFALALASTAFAAFAAPKPKTLVIMLDGARSDAIENGETPNFKRLMDGKWQEGYKCAWTPAAKTVPDALSSSGPNHAAIALGVSTAKNRVENNTYAGRCDYKKYPSWLVRIAEANPDAKTLFMYSWKKDEGLCPSPKVEFVWSRETASGQGLRNGTMRTCDRANGKELEKRFASDAAPDATLLFLDCPDHAGHGILTGEGVGFYPYSTAYLGAINECDGIIGRCLDAIASRPSFKDEDWLIAVTADHGGYATTHGLVGGHSTAIPLIVSSRHVVQGRIPGTPHNYDIAPTVLEHFGIDWSGFDLDGDAVGNVVAEPERARPLDEGLAVYMPFDGWTATNTVSSGIVPEICGTATKVDPRLGFIQGALCLGADTNGVGGLCLKGSESLKFENGADFALTMWVKMDAAQKGDTLIFGNKNWRNGGNPGIALCAAKCTENVKTPGVVFNCIGAGEHRNVGGETQVVEAGRWVPLTEARGRKRIDVGTYDVEFGKWTFYAVVRSRDGVIRLYQGASDGRLYCIYEDTYEIKLDTGLPFFLGQDGTGRYGRTFEGRIDDFALWTRELSHGDVRRIYESGRKGLILGDLL